MSKVLKITKPDKTVHVVPVVNKAFYQSLNNRLPADQRWKLEEIDEKDAKDLPFIDETHVTASEAVAKNSELQTQLSAKDQEIEKLKQELAAKGPAAPKFTAEQVIALVGVAKSVEQVNELVKGDDRTTVKAAAEAKIKELSTK